MKIGKSLRDAIWRAMRPIVLSSLLVVGQPRAVSTMRSNMAKAIITMAHFVCRLSLIFFRRCSMYRKLQFNQIVVNEESISKYEHVLLFTTNERVPQKDPICTFGKFLHACTVLMRNVSASKRIMYGKILSIISNPYVFSHGLNYVTLI